MRIIVTNARYGNINNNNNNNIMLNGYTHCHRRGISCIHEYTTHMFSYNMQI